MQSNCVGCVPVQVRAALTRSRLRRLASPTDVTEDSNLGANILNTLFMIVLARMSCGTSAGRGLRVHLEVKALVSSNASPHCEQRSTPRGVLRPAQPALPETSQ